MTPSIFRAVMALTLITAMGTEALAQSTATLPDVVVDVGRTIAQVQAFAKAGGDALWPGYGEAPFGFLLVSSDKEFLLCQPGPTPGFHDIGIDAATGCSVKERPRSSMGDNLLAAMPLISATPTIVMGTPATTGMTHAAWIRSILHEHFHQLQFSQPHYYARSAALDLAQSHPMDWQIAYPFPYASKEGGAAFAVACRALGAALSARGTPGYASAFDAYLAARKAFAASVSERDWRYFDFELWQEGVARWTEIQLALSYPDDDVRAAARTLADHVSDQLQNPDLAQMGRTAVYPLGAGEAMLMDACGPVWRRTYLTAIALTPLLTATRASCADSHT